MTGPTKPIFNRTTTELPRPAVPERPFIEPPPSPQAEPRRRHLWLAAMVGLLMLGVAVWAILAKRHDKVAPPPSAVSGTYTVERRDFVSTLRLNGTTAAVESRAVLVPQLSAQNFSELVITKLTPAGAKVKQGDVLLEFDRQGQMKEFLDRQAEYQDFVDQVAKKRSDEAAARAKDETELKQAEDDLEKAKLEMLKNEISSRIQAEKNRETLDEDQVNLKALRATFDLKRRAAEADIRVLEIQRDRAKARMLYARKNEDKLTVTSPMDGVVVLNTIWKGGKMGEVQEGDQVRPGQGIMQVINPEAMELRVPVNQADLPVLREDQHAEVRLDAYPTLAFPAKLQELEPIGKNSRFSDTIRTFTARFTIRGSDPRLMPDLSAAVDVELERVPRALVVSRAAILSEGGRTYVEAKAGLGFDKREIRLGPENDVEAVVESGIQAGEVVERQPGT